MPADDIFIRGKESIMQTAYNSIRNKEAIQRLLDGRQAPVITERKKSYWNRESRVECRLVHRRRDRIVLFHEIARRWNINGTIVEPPMFTIATYWTDRPYNLYCWFTENGSFAAAYFNIVALPGYRMNDTVLTYRDLVLDVFVQPHRQPVVLDMEELSDMDDATSSRVKNISASVLTSASQIIEESLSSLPAWLCHSPGS